MFQNAELNSSKIDWYSLTEQSVKYSNSKKALKCIAIAHSSLDQYTLIEQSPCSERVVSTSNFQNNAKNC